MMKASRLGVLVAVLLASSSTAQCGGTVKGQTKATSKNAPAPAPQAFVAPLSSAKHAPSIEFIGRLGRQRSIFEMDMMMPVVQRRDGLLFMDMRGQMDSLKNKEGNLGIGYREMIQKSVILGGYAYGDMRLTRRQNRFLQLTVGGEVLNLFNLFDLRGNAYFPQKKKFHISGADTARYLGNGIVTSTQYEQAMSGFDGEVGLLIPMPGLDVEPRIYVGSYRFKSQSVSKIQGYKGRFELRVYNIANQGSRLTLGVEASRDRLRRLQIFGILGLKLPMQFLSEGPVPKGLQRRMMDYVVRDVDIVTSDVAVSAPGQALRSDTKSPWKLVHVDPDAAVGGDGSVEKPYSNLSDMTFGAGDVIVLHKTGTSTLTANATPINLLDNNKVWGDRVSHAIVDSRDGRQYVVMAGSANVQAINQNPASPTIFMANNANVELSGFDFVNTVGGTDTKCFSAVSDTAGTYHVNISDVNVTTNIANANLVSAFYFESQGAGVFLNPTMARVNYQNTIASNNNIGVKIVSTAANAKTTLNASYLNFQTVDLGGSTSYGVLTAIDNGGEVVVNDNGGSVYKNWTYGIFVDKANNAADKITVSVSGAQFTTGANGMSGLHLSRLANMNLTQKVNLTVQGCMFNHAGAATRASIILDTTNAAINYGMNLTLNNNQFKNTTSTSSGIIVQGDLAGGTSQLAITATNNTFQGTAGGVGNAISFLGHGGVAASVGTIVLTSRGVNISGYDNAIGLGGSVQNMPALWLSLDFSSGDNIIGANTYSLNLSTAAGTGIANMAATYVRWNLGAGYVTNVLAGPNIAASGQFLKPIKQS